MKKSLTKTAIRSVMDAEPQADDFLQTGQLLEPCTVTHRDGFGSSSNEPAVASMSTSEKASPSISAPNCGATSALIGLKPMASQNEVE